MLRNWLHRTNKGSVKYPRKPKLFTGRDILRIWNGYIMPEDQATVLEYNAILWEMWRAGRREAENRLFGTLRWLRDWNRKILEAMWDAITWENAQEFYTLALELENDAEQMLELAVGYGARPSKPAPTGPGIGEIAWLGDRKEGSDG